MTNQGNLVSSSESRDFYVWVNPQSFILQANLSATGQFSSAELVNPDHALPFVRDPEFGGFVTPFMQNVTHNYGVEINLEQRRLAEFETYPSRMAAIYLFYSEDIAQKYADRNPDHVGDRRLERVHSVGDYQYSVHDSSWIDYLRIPHFWRPERVEAVTRNYWEGAAAEEYTLSSYGELWNEEPLAEVLYLGTVVFCDTSWVPEPSIGVARTLAHEPSDVFRGFLERREDSDRDEPPPVEASS